MRIVHVVRAPAGGVLRHICDLARGQTVLGHEVGVVCDRIANGAIEEERLEALDREIALGVTRISIGRGIGFSDVSAGLGVHRAVKALAPDVVHGHGAKGGAFARIPALFGANTARLYSPHGGSLHYAKGSAEGRFYFGIERMLERVTGAIVFVSEYERTAYREKIGEPRCATRLIYNGLGESEFEPTATANDAADVLFVGHMRDLKGVDVLIEALALVSRHDPALSALLVGAGEDRHAYEERVRALGLSDRIRFADPMPARAAFARGRLMVVPSRAESLPYIVLEAAAAGMPLIASNVGGIPEILGRNAEELVPPGDAETLAGALMRDLADMASAYARAERRRRSIMNRFSQARMTEEIVNLYEETLGK